MTAALVVQAVIICVLVLLVVGLVYSYAGLLERVRSLEADGPGPPSQGATPVRSFGLDATGAPQAHVAAAPPGRPARDIVGVSPDGELAVASVRRPGRDTLLAFLSSTCTTCEHLWAELAHGAVSVPGHVGVVIVTKGADRESPGALLGLATGPTTVVMSSEAWGDYEVPGSPYFVVVDGDTATVTGEGTALAWGQVLNLMALATGDAAIASRAARDTTKPRHDLDREGEVDRILMEAGIFPGDASLYPEPSADASRLAEGRPATVPRATE